MLQKDSKFYLHVMLPEQLRTIYVCTIMCKKFFHNSMFYSIYIPLAPRT